MTESSTRAWATIDLAALVKNLATVSTHCPDCEIIPVIKANAYGHGMEQTAKALAESLIELAGFAVATIDEALELRDLDYKLPLLLLPGFANHQQMELCFIHGIEPVVHTLQQLEQLEDYFQQEEQGGGGRIWLKFNTGMNRLGLPAPEVIRAYERLQKYPQTEVVLMSHLAWADDPEDPTATEFTQQQLDRFHQVRQQLAGPDSTPPDASFAASAGILTLPESHYQIVRPGIMLYGGSPFLKLSSEELGLLPVMTLRSRLIAINEVEAGASIGYGATYTCERDTRIGVLAVGYGDGYPRSAANGTPVLIETASGSHRTSLIGRVSMDMITIDLTDIADAQLGDEAVLWGQGLAAEEVAECAGTVSYELFCKVTERTRFEYL